jgi:hypothetical protein
VLGDLSSHEGFFFDSSMCFFTQEISG